MSTTATPSRAQLRALVWLAQRDDWHVGCAERPTGSPGMTATLAVCRRNGWVRGGRAGFPWQLTADGRRLADFERAHPTRPLP
jgi:hypothetical protein